MLDSVHHGKPSHESMLFQAGPLKFLDHGSGAAVTAEVLKDQNYLAAFRWTITNLLMLTLVAYVQAQDCRGIF